MSDDKYVYMSPGQDDVMLCRLECCEHELSTDVTTEVLQAPFIVLDLRNSEQQAMPPRYLIIGGSGFVWAHLYSFLGQCQAVATFDSRLVAGGMAFGATRERLFDSVLRCHRDPTHAFILHGVTNIDACARDPARAERINFASVRTVIDELVDHGVTPVFASSDAVFDGSRGLWTKQDTANPMPIRPFMSTLAPRSQEA